jgi:hypothetical protein
MIPPIALVAAPKNIILSSRGSRLCGNVKPAITIIIIPIRHIAKLKSMIGSAPIVDGRNLPYTKTNILEYATTTIFMVFFYSGLILI